MDAKETVKGRSLFRQLELEALEEGRQFALKSLQHKVEQLERADGALFPPEEVEAAQARISDSFGTGGN
jgi:hypothetical protein